MVRKALACLGKGFISPRRARGDIRNGDIRQVSLNQLLHECRIALMKQTLEYLKDRYNEEQSRFDHIENKCSRFITFLTVVIAGITALSSMRDGAIFQPSNALSWVALSLFLLGAFSTVCAWGHCFMALRVSDSSVLPRSREAAQYLQASTKDEAARYLFNCYVDTLEKVKAEIDQKSKYLEIAYQEVVISAWSLALVALITASMEIAK